MVCLAVHIPRGALASEKSAEVLAKWRRIAGSVPAKVRAEHAQPEAVALVAHHGILRSPGIATKPDRSAVLAITGSYWLDPDAERLATPDEALARLLQAAEEQPRLFGNFSYVLYAASGRVTAECGGLGVVPLYYMQRDGALSISSDLKFLLPLHRPALNRDAVGEYLTFGHLISDVTLLEGVRRLMPSTRLVAVDGQISLRPDALPPFARNQKLTGDVLNRLDHQFERAISRYAPDVSTVAVSLSGGMDSRTTLLAARKIGMEVAPWTAGEPGSLECKVARMVCDREHLPLHTHANDGCRMRDWFDRAVWFTEARTPPGHMHFFDAGFAGAITAGGQLHGLVGDVVVGGDYDTNAAVPSAAVALRSFCADRIQSMIYWPEGSSQRLGLQGWLSPEDVRTRVVSAVMDRCTTDDPYSTYLWSRYVHRGFGFIIPALVSQVSPWGEVMTPFIDPAFFATCASISHEAIADRRGQLAWAARRYPALVATPRVKDGILLPLSAESAGNYDGAIRNFRRIMQFRYYVSRLTGGRLNLKQRESYPFYALWYRNCRGIREHFDKVLLSEQSLARGLWKREGIEHLLHDLRVGRNVWDAIGSILMLETFARLFVDAAGDEAALRQ
jgi:hypothetical protein